MSNNNAQSNDNLISYEGYFLNSTVDSDLKYKAIFFVLDNKHKTRKKVYINGKEVLKGVKYKITVEKPSNGYFQTFKLINVEVVSEDVEKMKNDFLFADLPITKRKRDSLTKLYYDNIEEFNKSIDEELSSELKDSLRVKLEIVNCEFFEKFLKINNVLLLMKIITVCPAERIKRVFNSNPYLLYTDYNFNFFESLDLRNCLWDDDLKNLNRVIDIKGVVNYSIIEEFMQNHTLIPIDLVVKNTMKNAFELLSITLSETEIIETIYSMINNNELVFSKSKYAVSTKKMFETEKKILDTLLEINAKSTKPIKDVSLKSNWGIAQIEAFDMACKNNVSIISGYPGTGKSFLIEHLYKTFLSNYKKKEIEILTPTGRAASILNKKFDVGARTIHSFLQISKDDEIAYNKQPKDTKVIIIDEFSMVNIHIFAFLLYMCPELERIIFVGDKDQLECIGPGNLLNDLINSNFFHTTVLDELFRTDNKDIPEHFLAIQKSVVPVLESDNVSFTQYKDVEFLNNISDIYHDLIIRNNYDIDDVAFLVPINKGSLQSVNTRSLNSAIQKARIQFSDEKPKLLFTYKYGEFEINYYSGDKVIQTKNNYDKDIYNGEIGYIKKMSPKDETISIQFGNKIIEYSKSEFRENIELAYATTVHKYQGSESKVIIFTIFNNFHFMLTKKLMYTAVSRAKEKLYLFGDPMLYKYKIKNNDNEEILTNMSALIKTHNKDK
ncbi:ATP-dependent RecD-like DNA helicase [Mycoplasma sp. Mirounga ES2805-ORL]|uniref:ATP-dependent DNA helicase n=1 Tax=Mycoplasma sp. Mirounga ES2805-ORL TaxID=754514 RepID=UPI00197B54B4|nr:AAA family ATPase [Mycoplasma sp. Mirounga ES2805-ORL]QSF13507.1 AAA family ATPase [Mycoplasma sp. Mirounga ES2805-ORL]